MVNYLETTIRPLGNKKIRTRPMPKRMEFVIVKTPQAITTQVIENVNDDDISEQQTIISHNQSEQQDIVGGVVTYHKDAINNRDLVVPTKNPFLLILGVETKIRNNSVADPVVVEAEQNIDEESHIRPLELVGSQVSGIMEGSYE